VDDAAAAPADHPVITSPATTAMTIARKRRSIPLSPKLHAAPTPQTNMFQKIKLRQRVGNTSFLKTVLSLMPMSVFVNSFITPGAMRENVENGEWVPGAYVPVSASSQDKQASHRCCWHCARDRC